LNKTSQKKIFFAATAASNNASQIYKVSNTNANINAIINILFNSKKGVLRHKEKERKRQRGGRVKKNK
jgi:hypothetical protein